MIVAIEGGGTKFICAAGHNLNDILAIDNRLIIDTEIDPICTLSQVQDWIREKESKMGRVNGIGIATFGPLCLDSMDERYGSILSSPKESWSEFNILHFFKNSFKYASIRIDTDVNCAAIGEWRHGSAQGASNVVYITIGTGVGAGIIINGRILHGEIHPEVGHMRLKRLEHDQFRGACKFHGDCFEGMCSGLAMKQRTGVSPETTADDLIWSTEIEYIAQAIVNLIYILSPEKIILGGGVSKGGTLGVNTFFDRVREAVNRQMCGYLNIKSYSQNNLKQLIVPPDLHDMSAICGAFFMITE